MLVYQLGQTAGYTLDPRQIIDPRASYRLETAELTQQLAAPLRAHPGNAFQR